LSRCCLAELSLVDLFLVTWPAFTLCLGPDASVRGEERGGGGGGMKLREAIEREGGGGGGR
jgi:hypothetical protein